MKYKQRIFIILAFAAICCPLVFLGPALTEFQLKDTFFPLQSYRTHLREVFLGKGPPEGKVLHSRANYGAHLNFMRKDLDLSNYTGDNHNHENSSEVANFDLFDSKNKDAGKLSNKAENVINALGDDDDDHNVYSFNAARNSQQKKILSHLKDILMDDDTFLQEGNLEHLVYLADLIKHSAKTSTHRVLTKKYILQQLIDKLKKEGVIIPKIALHTKPPLVTPNPNVTISESEWTTLNKVKPSIFAGQKKRRRGRGPLLNIYPRPRK